MGMAEALHEPFDPLTDAAASALLEREYGIPNAAVQRRDTERDDTFRVTSDVGEFVFKVSHPADDPLLVNLQTAAMGFAAEADAGLPLQQVLPTLEGDIEAVLETDDGERVMRVLTWLPGSLLRDAQPTDEQLFELGATNARLVTALEDFRHPAAERELAWDVARLPALRAMLEFAPELTAFVDRFEALGPRIAALPHQVIHNDLNPGNVLVRPSTGSGTEGFIAGIIDFGDTVHTARAIDLAVTASYHIDPARGLASVDPLIDGYRSRAVLTDDELDLLPMLIAGRLALRVLIPSYLAGADATGAEYANRIIDLSRAQFASLEV